MKKRYCRSVLLVALFCAIPCAVARAKLIDPCLSTATSAGGTLLVCPAGDGPTLESIGATIHIRVVDNVGAPLAGIYYLDFWVHPRGITPAPLCDGAYSCNADHSSDANGETTISGSIAAGSAVGADVYAAAIGFLIQGTAGVCDNPLPLVLVSPDINADMAVTVADLAMFGAAYPPEPYDARADMDGNGEVSIADFVRFATHMGHACGR